MAQLVHRRVDHEWEAISLPSPDEHVIPGVPWGKVDQLFTPAFWATQAWLRQKELDHFYYKLGTTLHEEVAACLLAGYGMPSEVGISAFRALRLRGLLDGRPVSAEEIYEVLRYPFRLGSRSLTYRFAKQKSIYLSEYLREVPFLNPPEADPLAFRKWLLRFRGIGMKIASWITRNWLESDSVAVIDVHVYRAGLLARLYSNDMVISRDYLSLERKYLEFAQAINVRASILDCLIWTQMRQAAWIPRRLM